MLVSKHIMKLMFSIYVLLASINTKFCEMKVKHQFLECSFIIATCKATMFFPQKNFQVL